MQFAILHDNIGRKMSHPITFIYYIPFNCHLAIETQRGKTVREHRLCKFCLNLNIREIEDEFHFLMVCPLYEHIRHCYSIFENIHTNFNYFINIMSTNNPEHIQQLGSCMHIAMKIHT